MTENKSIFFEIFPWNENFNTGIDIIDEQHKVLVEILNRLAGHLANRSNVNTLNKVFDELANYADYHFKTEEKIWSTHFKNDVWQKTHEKTHGSFISKVLLLKKEDNHKKLDSVIHNIVSFLTKWLAYHILDTDKRMAKAVLNIKSGYTMEEAKNKANEEMSGSMQVLINTVLTMYDSLSTRTIDLMREKALRKQAEESLSQSEDRWKFILEGGSAGVWDWNIVENDASYLKSTDSIFDTVTDKILETESNSRIHPDDLSQVKKDLKAHLEGKTQFYINKHRIFDNRDRCHWILSRGKVVSRDKNGKALRIVGTHADVTENELATLIYQHSNQGMFVTDNNNNIIATNPAFTTITGYSAEQAVGKNPHFLSSGRHDKVFYEQLWKSVKETGKWSGQIWNKRKNGEVYPEIMNINSVIGDNNSLSHHLVLLTDITEQINLEENLRRTQKMEALGKLTGGIAHDYNNMLGVIIGYTNLLEKNLAKQPKLLSYASEINRASQRGAILTKKLLFFSRKDSSQSSVININKTLLTQQDMLLKTLTVRINLIIDTAVDLWSVNLDENELVDTILNLSINAMQAMTDNRSESLLIISTRNLTFGSLEAQSLGLTPGDYVQLCFKDTGTGIDKNIKEKIFDPFFTTKGDRGTGLGLSQVFGFIIRSGGNIKFHSQPELGSQFFLYFPRYIDMCTEGNSDLDKDMESIGGSETILVVDDEVALLKLTYELLKQKGYKIFCAQNSSEALKILESESIHLVLSDVIMPEIDGYQLAKIIREKYPEIKIQMVSGFSDELHEGDDRDLYDNQLQKPYDLELLFKNIRALLDQETT
ncbi:MAG: bacteriohemerythrin [Alcanivoracaceae bacterium]|nr:bacteriohemerythrin [Alcanivoracaceae bacterium]